MRNPEKSASSVNQSSEKLLSLIEVLSLEDAPVRLSDLSAKMNMNASTVSRFLTTLQNRGYVRQSGERGGYMLTYKICRIANNVTSRTDYRSVCQPYLKQIAKIFGCTTNLMVRDDDSVIYLDVIPGPEQLLIPLQRIGKIAPLYCTGGGKLFLSEFTDSDLREYAARQPFQAFTEYTICSLGELYKELRKVTEQGYAVDNQECELGTKCLAVPVIDYTGTIQMAISINAPASKLTDLYISQNAAVLRSIADQISAQLGYNQ